MDAIYILVQLVNAVQYGLLLFLVASGLTLLLGIMGIINLAHGVFYMLGAYVAFAFTSRLGAFWLALPAALLLGLVLGLLLERLFLRRLASADHLSQVLLSFGLILIINEAQRVIFGSDAHSVPSPAPFGGSIPLGASISYPVYRLAVSLLCLAIAAALVWLIQGTRTGMVLRAGAENRDMVRALGIPFGRYYVWVTAVGVGAATLAGAIAAPIVSVYPGMGEQILIFSFVVIVIGGLGSLKGAFAGALILGLVDTFGKAFFPDYASFTIYAAMILVLALRPAGLFGRPA